MNDLIERMKSVRVFNIVMGIMLFCIIIFEFYSERIAFYIMVVLYLADYLTIFLVNKDDKNHG